MKRRNKEIVNAPDLNENYQIGEAYFFKLKILNFLQLWLDYLCVGYGVTNPRVKIAELTAKSLACW